MADANSITAAIVRQRSKFKGYVVRRVSDGSAVYVGITTRSLKERWWRHVKEAREGASYAISNAIRKHGADAFSIEHAWCSIDHEGLKEAERTAIVHYGTRSPSGYNLTDGGDGTFGLRLTGSRNGMFGRVNPPEDRAKFGGDRKGRKLSPEHADAISAGLRKRPPPTEETKAKISAAHQGKLMSEAACAAMSAAKKGKPGRKQTPEEQIKRAASIRAAWVRRRLAENGPELPKFDTQPRP